MKKSLAASRGRRWILFKGNWGAAVAQAAYLDQHPLAGTGRLLHMVALAVFTALTLIETLYGLGLSNWGFPNWLPVALAFVLWSIAYGAKQVLMRGIDGQKALFILPASLFTIAMAVFPTAFGLFIAFSDWNLSSLEGRKFNGLDNLYHLFSDAYYWNAMANMLFYLATVVLQYVVAFGLALLLNADIRGRKFFRVAFLLPFMLSPVAVSWMIGSSLMNYRFGPFARLARYLGWENPAFFASPWIAKTAIAAMDAWVWVPFMIIMLLAGLQAIPKELSEAAKVDGATQWQNFWQITFPLMLPISITACVLRIIFQLKLADIVINVTAGGPGGATDTVSSFIFREYRDRSNVGYGTMAAEFYLFIIIIFITILLSIVRRWIRKIN